MKNFEFRLLIWLLKRYTREVDQYDHIKLNNGSNDWFIAIAMGTQYPHIYREINK